MSKLDTLHALSTKLDEAEGHLVTLDRYYAGEQPLTFLAPEAKEALGDRFARMCSNIPRLAVTSLAERLRVTGFTRGGSTDPALWSAWVRNDLDQLAPVAHREALTLGRSFALVWADNRGRSQVSIESARQATVLRDPASREVLAGLKRWVSDGRGHAVLYEADQITRYLSTSHVVDPAAMPPTAWDVAEIIDNPLGVVPLVPLVNTDRLLDTDGRSELADLLPLVDALNKSLADLMVASEYFARPRRWATGVELVVDDETGEATNPFPEGNRMMISEGHESKFGQLPAADLAAYESGVRVLLGQIMAVSALPAHYVGIFTDNPTSADSLRAAEASLAARAEARQATFGRAWEQVARLMAAIDTDTDPQGIEIGVTWADPATRSIAQEADAIVKLHASGILPTSFALSRLGYTSDEIDEIRTARRAEALDLAGTDIKALTA